MSFKTGRRYWLTFMGVAGAAFILYGLSLSDRPADMTTEARVFLKLGFYLWCVVVFVIGLGNLNKRSN